MNTFTKILAMIVAPFVVFAWCIMNPKKVWIQAKKEWSER